MTNDEMTISVIEGMLGLIDNSNAVSRSRLSDFKYWLVELKNIFHDIKNEESEKEITGDTSVHVYFPSLKAKTAVKIPIVDGIVTIDGRNMEDILMLVREGYTKEEDLKRKLIDNLNQLITDSFNSNSISP